MDKRVRRAGLLTLVFTFIALWIALVNACPGRIMPSAQGSVAQPG
jgi:hypothetical protein